MAKVTAHLDQGFRTTLSVRNHTFIADEPESDGGTDQGPNPMEYLRGALASCTAITVKSYALRKQWALDAIDVTVDIQRFNGTDYPDYSGDAVYVHEFRIQIALHGALTDQQKARLMEIATKCPVRRAIASPSFFKEELLETQTLPKE